MARRNSSRRRDTTAIPNQRLPVARYNPLSESAIKTLRPMSLQEFEDFRTWHPDRNRWPRDFSGPVTRLRAVDRIQRFASHPERLLLNRVESILPSNPLSYIQRWKDNTDTVMAFADPRKTLTCVRRQIRKEVLHALHLVRRGGGGSGKVLSEWNDKSNIRCK